MSSCCCCCCLFINSTQPPSLECIEAMKGTAGDISPSEVNQTRESTSALSRRCARQGPRERDGTNVVFMPSRNMKVLGEGRPRRPRRDGARLQPDYWRSEPGDNYWRSETTRHRWATRRPNSRKIKPSSCWAHTLSCATTVSCKICHKTQEPWMQEKSLGGHLD